MGYLYLREPPRKGRLFLVSFCSRKTWNSTRKSKSNLCPFSKVWVQMECKFWFFQKIEGVANARNSLIFSLSGQKDSNLRPPAPKAGALAGLRHTPKKKTMQPSSFLFRGEGGIRTPGTLCRIRQFSKLLVSATHPPLLGCELRCKNRHFPDTHKSFLPLFFNYSPYRLNFSKIIYRCFFQEPMPWFQYFLA